MNCSPVCWRRVAEQAQDPADRRSYRPCGCDIRYSDLPAWKNRVVTETSGLLIIDKPAGLTSHQVVGRVRRVLGTRKVGHAGTLDPMATGVLIVGINRATRLLGHLALHDKAYSATIRLGIQTTTDDAEGEPVTIGDAGGLDPETIEDAMAGLRGAIHQVPSSVSAIKIAGQRAHALVRAGERVSLAARPVKVARFEATGLHRMGAMVDLDVAVICSSGTYVQALARDLGGALGVGGHLTRLRRTRIGRYDLAGAIALDRLAGDTPLLSMARAAELSFPVLRVGPEDARSIGFGRPLDLRVPADPTGMIGPDGTLLALYRPAGEQARAVAVLN